MVRVLWLTADADFDEDAFRAAGERAYQRWRAWVREGRPIWTARLERPDQPPVVDEGWMRPEGAAHALAELVVAAEERGERWWGRVMGPDGRAWADVRSSR